MMSSRDLIVIKLFLPKTINKYMNKINSCTNSIQCHGVVNEYLYWEGAGFSKDFVHVVEGVDYSVEFSCVV